MSFEELREKPIPIATLRADWTAEEEKFSCNLPNFIKSMAVCNENFEPTYLYKEEKVETQPLGTKEVPIKSEKVEEKIKETSGVSVELANVPGTSQIGSSTLQPLLRESKLNTKDPLDDMFSSPPENSQIATQEVDPFTPQRNDGQDIFDTKTSSPAPAFDDFLPPKKAEQVVVAPIPEAPKKEISLPKGTEVFDETSFKAIRATADEMLAGLPKVDLQTIMDSMGSYSICLDLDHLRANQTILTDTMLEIQSKRDELHSRTLYLTPLYYSMESAADYYCDVGLICSLASSREKRIAELKFRIPEFWKRYSDVIRTKEIVEKTALHLDRQYECISRLITGFQIKNQVKEISRGEVPFDTTPTPQAVVKSTELPPVDNEVFNRSMSQPITTKKNFQSLESFDTGQPKISNKSTITGTKETEW